MVNLLPLHRFRIGAQRIAAHAADGQLAARIQIGGLNAGIQARCGHVREDGTVQIDKSKCIGCQFCAMACPYGVRYLNQEERVVEKCTLCEQRISQGELPQCVAQCGARARFFGDLDQGVDNFEGPAHPDSPGCQYEEMTQTRVKLKDYVEPYAENDIHHLADAGNEPKLMYLMREGRKWRE